MSIPLELSQKVLLLKYNDNWIICIYMYSRISVLGDINMVEKFTVEIANMTGHSVVEMTREEIQETAKQAGAGSLLTIRL